MEDSELIRRFDELREQIREQIRDTETRLLTEFWKWGRTSDVRSRQFASTIALHDERLQALEDRITDLERNRPRGGNA